MGTLIQLIPLGTPAGVAFTSPVMDMETLPIRYNPATVGLQVIATNIGTGDVIISFQESNDGINWNALDSTTQAATQTASAGNSVFTVRFSGLRNRYHRVIMTRTLNNLGTISGIAYFT
jgi:hypothetical protein